MDRSVIERLFAAFTIYKRERAWRRIGAGRPNSLRPRSRAERKKLRNKQIRIELLHNRSMSLIRRQYRIERRIERSKFRSPARDYAARERLLIDKYIVALTLVRIDREQALEYAEDWFALMDSPLTAGLANFIGATESLMREHEARERELRSQMLTAGLPVDEYIAKYS